MEKHAKQCFYDQGIIMQCNVIMYNVITVTRQAVVCCLAAALVRIHPAYAQYVYTDMYTVCFRDNGVHT